jgi:hypothetical protein
MDMTKEIMDKWYQAMEKNKISVQPKASTILGTVLSQYKIELKEEEKDIWSEFLTITGGQFAEWYESLSEEEKKIFHKQREKAKKSFHSKRKQLLKG